MEKFTFVFIVNRMLVKAAERSNKNRPSSIFFEVSILYIDVGMPLQLFFDIVLFDLSETIQSNSFSMFAYLYFPRRAAGLYSV